MAVLGLRFCARAFSSCGKWGPLFIAVHGPLTIAASLVAEHRLQTRRLSNCGSRAQLLRGMCDLPRPGLEPVSPALAGRFSTTVPPGKPPHYFKLKKKNFFSPVGSVIESSLVSSVQARQPWESSVTPAEWLPLTPRTSLSLTSKGQDRFTGLWIRLGPAQASWDCFHT